MTDSSWNDELSEEEIGQLDALLANPDLWEEPSSTDEDAIVAAILAEASGATDFSAPAATSEPPAEVEANRNTQAERNTQADVINISRGRRWVTPLLSAAAGLVIALLGVAAFNSFNTDTADGTVELALAGTDLAPEANATAEIVGLRSGTRIVIDVSSLEPAPPGSYYELWLRKDAEVGVSAGTFHLRGGDGEIELWAGVSLIDYPLVTVTIQDEAETLSSGRVVLKGLAVSN